MLAFIGDNTYNLFHNFWNTINLGIPEMTIHYEHITSEKVVSAAFKSVILFMAQFGQDSNSMTSLLSQQVDKVKSMVREPQYEHGTLFARVCGVDAAIKLHKMTMRNSEALGYTFDYNSGYWSLKDI